MIRNRGKKIIIALIAGIIVVIGIFVVGLLALIPVGMEQFAEHAVYTEEVAVDMPAKAPMPTPSPAPAMDKAQTQAGFAGRDGDMAARNVAPAPQAPSVTERKIIKSSYMALETIEFERTTDAIVGKAIAMGGYVESSSVQGTSLRHTERQQQRTANFQIRIPQKHFEGFMSAIGELGVVVNKQLFGEDITGQYIDTEARLRTLKTQEDRLLAILARAEKLTDIIEVERELSRIRFEIESHTGSLKTWDHLIQYSRVGIDVYEVEELKPIEQKPENWFDRLVKAFTNSITNLVDLAGDVVVFLVAAIPYLAVLSVIAFAGWKLLFKRTKRIDTKGGNESEK